MCYRGMLGERKSIQEKKALVFSLGSHSIWCRSCLDFQEVWFTHSDWPMFSAIKKVGFLFVCLEWG